MSCDNSTYCSAIIHVRYSNQSIVPGDDDAPMSTDLDCRSRKRWHRGIVASHSRCIPDSTQIDPEQVWGDEGPLND